jgi:hypothetical protein
LTPPNAIQVDQDLLDKVPIKYRDLFIGICAIIEKSLRSAVSATKRRQLLEKLAKLLSAQ